MADTILNVVDPISRQLVALRLKDNGDGTFSLGATATGAGGGPATIADGADVAEGAIADAVVAAGAAGSLSAKLRRVTTDLSALLALFPADVALNSAPAKSLSSLVLGAAALGNDGTALQLVDLSTAAADGASNTANRLRQSVVPHTFNETSWDRERGNTEGTVFASGVYAASHTSAIITNYNARAISLYLNVTGFTAGSVQLLLWAVDPVSGLAYQVSGSPTAVAATGKFAYQIGPGLSPTQNAGDITKITQQLIPRTLEVRAVHTTGDNITYSVGYALHL